MRRLPDAFWNPGFPKCTKGLVKIVNPGWKIKFSGSKDTRKGEEPLDVDRKADRFHDMNILLNIELVNDNLKQFDEALGE